MAVSIAIVIVMFIINAFMVYAIVRTWERVGEKVEKYFLVKTADFVKTEGSKAEEKREGTGFKGTEKVIQTKEIFLSDQSIDRSCYRNADFKEDYKAVKENMDFSKQEIIKDVISSEQKSNSDSAVIELVRDFDFDTIYQLSTLQSDEQREVLKASLTEEQLVVLNDYLSFKSGAFSCIDFFDYVAQLAKRQDPNFYVKTGWSNDSFEHIGDNVVTVHDKDITEGLKIVYKDKLYDYSI